MHLLKRSKNFFLSSQMSESIFIGILLATIGGFLETYSFISREQVFANCQTGNLVLLATNASQHNLHKILIYAIPILAFIVGVLLTEIIKNRFRQHPKIHWRQILVIFEVFLLLVVGFIPSGNYNITATTIISFSCALQYDSFRKIKGSVCATTMCTGNLRSCTDNFFVYITTKDPVAKQKMIQYLFVIVCFMIGAIIGSLTTRIFLEKAVWICCLILIIVFILMFIKEDLKKTTDI